MLPKQAKATKATMQPGVAIVRRDTHNKVDLQLLEAQGLKLRTAVSCLPDLILSKSGKTVAFILLDNSSMDISAEDHSRIAELGRSFSNAFVLAVTAGTGTKKADHLDLALSQETTEAPMLLYRHGTNLTQQALQLYEALSNVVYDELASERTASITSSSAVQCVLCGIPGAALTESEASSLQLCGSIKDISQCSLQTILDYSDLAPDRAQALHNFFGL